MALNADVSAIQSDEHTYDINDSAAEQLKLFKPIDNLMICHPLDPLNLDEIDAISLTIRAYIANNTSIKAIKFLTSNIIAPPKKDILAFLGIPLLTGERPAIEKLVLVRNAESDFIDLLTGEAYNVRLSLVDGRWAVETLTKLPEGTEPQISPEELMLVEPAVRKDPRVIALAAEVGVLPEQICCDGWAIGYDDRFPASRRVQQTFLYARYYRDENFYAHPLDFVPVLDSNSMEVIHIDFPPHRDSRGNLSVNSTAPKPLSEDSLESSGRGRIQPPQAPYEFLPDLIKNYNPRQDLKPLHVIQPEGVSFQIRGNELEWQNWKMHVAFHHREGIAISTVTYNDNGVLRPMFYRLSLAEMVVPYGAPEFPHPRKLAFDAGEYGLGTMANELSLGCDCLGSIHYLPGHFVNHSGKPVTIEKAICIHEEDAGVLWKHGDPRPGGRSFTARSRRLVISMCCTLANYEYIWNYRFYQDGTVEFETRLTGVLQVYVAAEGENYPYGTIVAPGINAQYHQHLFSLRIDPMIDGLNNSVVETDIIAHPDPPGSDANFAGNAFMTETKTLKTSAEGARDYSFEKDRRWKIVNPNVPKHYSTGATPGYGIQIRGGVQTLLAKERSWLRMRAAFGTKTLWVIKDKEGPDGSRVWPAGKYVPQTRAEPDESLASWVREDAPIENEDIVLFLTLGINHIPRAEDWPVMPVEHVNIYLKPQNFFRTSPAMDVPAANDRKSRLALAEDILS